MPHFHDLYLFTAVVEAGSFTGAGERLGMSKSALSQSLAALEKRLNIRLLNRTTRSVSPTPEGLTLYNDIAPHFAAIGTGLEKLAEHQSSTAGTVRINAPHLAVDTVILPKLSVLLVDYPLISIDIHSDNNFVDIVAQGFDMGVRLGGDVASDMVAVRISPPLTTVLVATPQYLHGKQMPKHIGDLDSHRLIGHRVHPHKPPLAWEFGVDGKCLAYTPKAQTLTNGNTLHAVKNHLGIGLAGLVQAEDGLERGELVEVLGEFRMTYDPFFAYYPSRKHHSRAFELVLNALREG